MLYKVRSESQELLILKSLNARMNLSDKDKKHYLNLKKGYEGEVLFDSMMEKLQCDCFILNDLLMKFNNTVFQIDSLVILGEAIYLFEVKNYDGDYYYDADRLYKSPDSEITNPLNQLGRSETLFRQLLQKLGFHYPIYASVVFVNPQFTLYQAPRHKPFIFPTQIQSYLEKLNTTSSKLSEKHRILAKKLKSMHLEDYPFKIIPSFNYEHLQKGIICAACQSISIAIVGKSGDVYVENAVTKNCLKPL